MRPLHLATLGGYADIVELLLREKATVNVQTIDGYTALHFAAEIGHKDIVQILLNHDANINVNAFKNNQKYPRLTVTPLHLAILNEHNEVMDILLSKGADHSPESCTVALELCIRNRRHENIRYLMNNSAQLNDNCLQMAVTKMIVFEELLAAGHDINRADSKHRTALHFSVFNKNSEMSAFLIKSGIDINARYTLPDVHIGQSALQLAVQQCQPKTVKLLLNGGATIENKAEFEDLLELAVRHNSKEMVQILTECGRYKTSVMESSLFLAAICAYNDIVTHFLEIPINPNITSDSMTPLHMAAMVNSIAVAKTLLSKGAHIESKNKNGETALMLASCSGHTDMVRMLLAKGARINTQNNSLNSPLQAAAKYGFDDMIIVLLENGADVEMKDNEGRTSIGMAVGDNHLKCVRNILKLRKINLNKQYCDAGLTLLHIAAEQGNLEVTECLVGHGADIHGRNANNSKPIQSAAREGRINIVEYYLQKGLNVNEPGLGNETPLHSAAATNQSTMVNYLLSKGANANAVNKEQLKPIDIAVYLSLKETVKILMCHSSISPIIRKTNLTSDMSTLIKILDDLNIAVKSNKHVEIKRLITTENAQVNSKYGDNTTILHYAAWKGFLESAKVILQNGGDPNLIGKNNSTPLHYAVKFGHLLIVKQLLAHGAIFDRKCANGKTPVDLCENQEIKKLMTTVKTAFRSIQCKDIRVLSTLNKIQDVDTQKAIANARNSDGQSIFIAAVRHHFPDEEELFEIFQENSHMQVIRAVDLIEQEKFYEAQLLLTQVLVNRAKLFGIDSPPTLYVKHYINEAKYRQFKYDEVFRSWTEMYEIQKNIFGEDNKYTIQSNNSRAMVLYRQSKNEEAFEIIVEVCERQKKISGEYDLSYGNCLNTLGLVSCELEKYEEALEAQRTVFKIHKKLSGPKSEGALIAVNNIGLVYAKQNKFDEAIKAFEEVHRGRKSMKGENHSDTLRPLLHLATMYQAQEKYNDALQTYNNAIEVQTKYLGPHHHDTLTTKLSMAQVFYIQGNFLSALKICMDCIPKLQNIVGPFHPLIIQSQQQLNTIRKAMDLGNQVDVQQMMQKIESDFFAASAAGDIKTVVKSFEFGQNVNATDKDGRSALQFAVHGNHKEVVQFLLSKGAVPTLATNKGNTTLHAAVNNDNKEISKLLIDHVKTNSPSKLIEFVNAKTTAGGSTALHVAAKNGFYNIAHMLLNNGAFYNLTNGKGETPSATTKSDKLSGHFEFIDKLFAVAKTSAADLISELRSFLTDPHKLDGVLNVRNSQSQTLFDVAIASGHGDAAQIRNSLNDMLHLLCGSHK